MISADLRQPGFIEPRTTGIVSASHDFGPDPYDVFFRHRVDPELAVERTFWKGILYARLGLHNTLYFVPGGQVRLDGTAPPSDSVLTFWEQIIRLDLRDDAVRPHTGFFVQVALQQAGYFIPSSWDYLRVLPDVRAYIPLPWHITIAARFALGMLFISGADDGLDPLSQQLGPRDYRLRGGGASSNRGYLPGRLGDGLEGGTRRWEGSLELRIPLFNDFGLALFGDVGDVSREETFRWNYPQTSAGFGLRYFTIVGALRADFAWKLPGLQVLGQEDQRVSDFDSNGNTLSRGGPFVFHLTIGQAF